MQFNYEARTQNGEIQVGTVESSDEKSAIEFLQRHNLIVISVKSNVESAGTKIGQYLNLFHKVKKKDLAIFSRQMAILIESKVSLVQALRAVVDQSNDKIFKNSVYDIASSVESGTPFSAALSRYPDLFTPFYINLIKSGEASGDLEGMLVYLAGHLEKESELESKVKGAMIYPAVILFVFGIVGVIFMVYIVPKITAMFEESGRELPILTKMLIAVSDLLINYGLILLILLLIVGWLVGYWVKNYNGNEVLDAIKIKLPVFGSLYQKIYITQFAENLSTLITGGIPLIDALHISANVIENTVYRKMVILAANKVKTGETISSVFYEHSDLIPPMVVTMIRIGEKTGKLDTVLKKVSYFYSKEVDEIVNNISSLIEPIIILVLGVSAALLVAAILLPIYDIASA